MNIYFRNVMVLRRHCLTYFMTVMAVFISLNILSCSSKKDDEIRVRIGYLQTDLHQLAVFVALEKGLFLKEDVNIEIGGIFKAGPEEMSAFAAGSLDVGYVGEAPATTAVANGITDVKVLAQVNKEGSALLVGKNSPIKSIEDLRGKTIAIPGFSTVQDFLVRKALVRHGMGFNEVKIIVIKPPEMMWALESGDIDAFIAWEPHVAKTITKGIGRILLTSHDIWEHHPCCVLVADNGFLEEHPEVIRKIVQVHIKATDFINAYPDEAVKIGIRYTGMDENAVRQAMKNIEFDYLPSREGEMEYVDFLNSLGYIKIVDPKAFTDTFIDSSFLKEIVNE
ncbi:MAG: ABC transporter substrate-binding protein [Thermodesulfobacteriota bacterium]|nr:ABC transporter substrate-binding protein [Thermodesulfobacteriota bacterium]